MYTVLVAEDAKWIRKGIVSLLKQGDYPIQRILEALDGKQALELIQKEKPQIVITDIKMPYKDGIELIRDCQSYKHRMEFAIITGYAEFHYAEQALNMGVRGYLLKPIKNEAFHSLIEKIIHHLEKKKRQAMLETENVKLKEIQSQQTIEQWVNSVVLDRGKIQKMQDQDGQINENGFWKVLSIVHLEGSNYYQSTFDYGDEELLKFSISNILDEIEKECDVQVFHNYENKNQLFLLFQHSHKGKLKISSDQILTQMHQNINKLLQIKVTIGISETGKYLTKEMYKQAKEALKLRFIHENNQIYRYDGYKNEEYGKLPQTKIKLFHKCLERRDQENIRILLDDFFHKEELVEKGTGYIEVLWMTIANLIVRTYGLDIHTIDTLRLYQTDKIDCFGNLQELKAEILRMIQRVIENEGEFYQSEEQFIKKIKNYIEDNYMRTLTIQDIAKQFLISNSNLSSVFKKNTGKNISKYLTEKKIEEACRLLRETEAGIGDIAQSVGYGDVQYFYRVFKKYTEKTPLEYRREAE